eukprot:gene1911-2244_t
MGAGVVAPAGQAGTERMSLYQGKTTFADCDLSATCVLVPLLVTQLQWFAESSVCLAVTGCAVTVIVIAVVAAAGGLVFGYDIGITGGVISHPGFTAMFFGSHDGGNDPFCKYDDHLLQLFTSCLFLAGAVAAIVGSYTCRRFGRRPTMMAGGFCFLVGSGLAAGAVHIAMLVLGRVVLGVGVGFATQATPLYLSEMAPFKLRGALNLLFQMAVTIGILAAQLINYGTKESVPHGWRISLALGGVPALLLFVGSMLLPDTPNSLVQRGRSDDGRRVLQRIRGTDAVDVEFEDICEAVNVSNSVKTNPYRTILKRRYWPQLFITILIPAFQQLTGINAIMFYAPQLFQAAGQGADAALLSSVINGAVNVISTVVAIVAVDRLGRKFLFIQGGVQMIICEVVVGVLVKYNFEGPGNSAIANAIIAFICLYVAAFAWSCMKWGAFLFFAGFVVLMTIFVIIAVPETKGVPIEELSEVILNKHWLWSRVAARAPRDDDGLIMEGPASQKVAVHSLV